MLALNELQDFNNDYNYVLLRTKNGCERNIFMIYRLVSGISGYITKEKYRYKLQFVIWLSYTNSYCQVDDIVCDGGKVL